MPARDQGRCNLILGAIDNYAFYEVGNFLLSLRQTSFDGHVCLFAGLRTGTGTIAKIDSLGVEVVRFGDALPFVPDPHPDNVMALPEPIHICNLRYFLYLDYLLKHGDRFANVLITDIRDVVFQKDPFDFPIADRVHVAMENTDIPIGSCPWTAPWTVRAYGEETLEQLKDKQMSCSGTTLAPIRLMIGYLRAMLGEIAIMKSAGAYLDQAAHNVVLHAGGLGPVERLYNFHGAILTVGSEPAYRLNEKRELVNEDGSVPGVVHQYDRHPELARLFEAKVRPTAGSRLWSKTLFRAGRKAKGLLSRLRG